MIVVYKIDWKVFVATRIKHSTSERERERKKKRTALNIHAKNFQTRVHFFAAQLGKIEIAIIWFICCIKFNSELCSTVKQNVIPNSKSNNLLLSANLFLLHINWVGWLVGQSGSVFSSFSIIFFTNKISDSLVYLLSSSLIQCWRTIPNWSEEYSQIP